jgi:hypothetical protein
MRSSLVLLLVAAFVLAGEYQISLPPLSPLRIHACGYRGFTLRRETSSLLSGREGHFYEARGIIRFETNLSTDQNAPISLHPLCVVFRADRHSLMI